MIYAVVGAGVAILVIIGAVTYYCKCRRKKTNNTNHTGPNGAISRFDAHNGRQIGSLSECGVPGRGLTKQPSLDEYGLPGPSEPVYDFDTTPDETEN
jgi:hypothetical protein